MRKLELQHELDVLEVKELELNRAQDTKLEDDEDGAGRRPADSESFVIDLTVDDGEL